MPRATALHVLTRVDEGAYSHLALDAELERSTLSDRDRGLTAHLVYATLTWQRALDTMIHACLLRHTLDPVTLRILRLGVVQLVFLDRIPEHAAVSESVDLAREHAPESAPLVNAVLRRIIREKPLWYNPQDQTKKPVRFLANRWSLPNWLANRMEQQLGMDRANKWMEAMNSPPPIWLRARKKAPEGLLAHPSGAYRADTLTPHMQGLLAGDWVVQDLAAQFVGMLVDVHKDDTVWDACAGLGGKALHLLDLGAKVTASDPNVSKLHMLQNMPGGKDVTILEGKAEFLSPKLGEFDVVLLDAPCSSLGVIRRHPETRWTRNESAITSLEKLQKDLLDTVVPHVKVGGHLVYSVCTFTREETTKQIENFLKRHPEFELVAPPESLQEFGVIQGSYLVTDPSIHDCDAFFAARLRRLS